MKKLRLREAKHFSKGHIANYWAEARLLISHGVAFLNTKMLCHSLPLDCCWDSICPMQSCPGLRLTWRAGEKGHLCYYQLWRHQSGVVRGLLCLSLSENEANPEQSWAERKFKSLGDTIWTLTQSCLLPFTLVVSLSWVLPNWKK